MTKDVMSRDEQIKFMSEASERRKQRHKRWSEDEEFKSILRKPVEEGTEDD